jgi:hypothetical protein
MEPRIGEKSKSTETFLDWIRSTAGLGVEFAHVDIQGPGMKGIDGHEQAAHVEQRQQVQVDISR